MTMYANCLVILMLVVDYCLSMSFNQPKFSPCAFWNTNATTFANETSIGQQTSSLFINIDNDIYVSDQQNNRILMWHNGSWTDPITLANNSINAGSLFVTDNSHIYVDRWVFNSTHSELVMKINSPCARLFADILSRLYCSATNEHRVYMQELSSSTLTPKIVGGTGCPGPVASMLDHPHGIFVDEHFHLFVADTHNHRIQLFRSGEMYARTVAGFGAPVIFILNRPTSVVVDGDGYLFIVDSENHRIVRSISDRFVCLFGCTSKSGRLANELNHPEMMAFDKDGNVFVTDMNNHRIQKFTLIQNSYGMYVHHMIR